MQIVSSSLASFSKTAGEDLVIVGVTYTADTGQVFYGQVNGSDADLTTNAQNAGKQTWDEQDIADLYTVSLTDTDATLLTDRQTTFLASVQSGTVTLGVGTVSTSGTTTLA